MTTLLGLVPLMSAVRFQVHLVNGKCIMHMHSTHRHTECFFDTHSQASAQLLSSEMKEEKAVSASNRKELMDKAHILEHAYNKKCFLEVCEKY